MALIRNINNTHFTDEELVEKYKQTESLETLSILYERYMDLVFGVCLKYLKNAEDAKDTVIEIFEILAQKLKKHEVVNFKSWLYTLAKNQCLMTLRKGKKVSVIEFQPDFMQKSENMHLSDIMEKEEKLSLLENCIKKLSDKQQNAIELFYLKNKSYNEIEQLTNAPFSEVRSLIQNGKRNLKICMEENSKANEQ